MTCVVPAQVAINFFNPFDGRTEDGLFQRGKLVDPVEEILELAANLRAVFPTRCLFSVLTRVAITCIVDQALVLAAACLAAEHLFDLDRAKFGLQRLHLPVDFGVLLRIFEEISLVLHALLL